MSENESTIAPRPYDPGEGETGFDGFRYTEVGNANRLVAAHGVDLRFVPLWGKWLAWDGTRWATDHGGTRVTEFAKSTVQRMFDAVPSLRGGDQSELFKHARRSDNRSEIASMVHLARSVPSVTIEHERLDADPWVINLTNGTVDLRTGELMDHNPDRLCSRISPVMFDPDAEAPEFHRFLERVLPDEEVREYVQRFVGYCLTGNVGEQVFPIWWGDGANGKSTLINLVRQMLGDYGVVASRDLILWSRHESHDTKLVDLFRSRFAFRVETRDSGSLDEARVKELTGGDRVKARRMREDYWEFAPTHKLLLATNHPPQIRGTDHAIWRRIHFVPFGVQIPKEEQVPDLDAKLFDNELAGIFNWALAGCRSWQERGLDPPTTVRAATEHYRKQSDSVGRFFDAIGLVRNPDARVPHPDLQFEHESWCGDNGIDSRSHWKRVTSRLAEWDAESVPRKITGPDGRRTSVKVWLGVGLARHGAAEQSTLGMGEGA